AAAFADMRSRRSGEKLLVSSQKGLCPVMGASWSKMRICLVIGFAMVQGACQFDLSVDDVPVSMSAMCRLGMRF
ncbi:MAG: hypothetical protein ACHRHE_25005, partial [Tepidisphaerales bacterium]